MPFNMLNGKIENWSSQPLISINICSEYPNCLRDYDKGLDKLGNIVAETLLRRQMFPSLAGLETYVAETNFAALKQENVFALCQKHFCYLNTNFASETYVSQFSHHESNVD